ncbi:MAG: phosphoglycerate dehydrogenase [Planctomycetota bacterium]
MFQILKLNQISLKGLERFPQDKYELASEFEHPDAILLRSHQLEASQIAPSVKAVARAGAGVNNIPISVCTARGIPVFNTPGANANAVKELVLAVMLLSSRGILPGIEYVKTLHEIKDSKKLNELLEKEKNRFRGSELEGKTLGVVGLGAIGSLVAEIGLSLGMEVLGYDPAISIEAAWKLSRDVRRIENLNTLLSKSHFVSLHLPVLDSTRNMINKTSLKSFKTGAKLFNFAREEIVFTPDLIVALDEKKLSGYYTDFPTPELIARKEVLLLPHIGASTEEAEENCALLSAKQLVDFLENGNVKFSVNFPETSLDRQGQYRIAITNKNVPKILGKMLSVFADRNINISDMLNKSRNEIAYNLIDIDCPPSPEILEELRSIEEVLNVRAL